MARTEMSLKFSDKPQLSYAPGYSGPENPESRLPAGAMPIATAPERSGQAVIGYERDGVGRWMLHQRDTWRELNQTKDFRSGETRWMMGRTLNPIAWAYPARKGT